MQRLSAARTLTAPSCTPRQLLRSWAGSAAARVSCAPCVTSSERRRQRQQQQPLQARFAATTARNSRRRPAVAFIIAGGAVAAAIYYLATPPAPAKVLNRDTFVPYTVTSRDAVSASTFILTVEPQQELDVASLNYLDGGSKWRYPLWSVEFKQPEVQIARHYTPLPPPDMQFGEEGGEGGVEGEERGRLRFYVRAVPGGEMSTYLGRQGVGRTVWLRGAHAGFDVVKRLGERKSVVFLAGGTGLAPAMQAARAVLDGGDADTCFTLLWSVRSREEVFRAGRSEEEDGKRRQRRGSPFSWWGRWRSFLTGGPGRTQQLEIGPGEIAGASPLGRELATMKARYGERLRIRVGIDEESSQFRASDVAAAVQAQQSSVAEPSAAMRSSSGCRLHSQELHALLSEFEPVDSSPPSSSCTCAAEEGAGGRGRNLFVVSGPSGFVSHYAGPKVWREGRETQGVVGGVAGELRRGDAGFAAGWLVLKL